MAGSLELELSCVRISGGEVDLDFRLLACFAYKTHGFFMILEICL